MPGGNLVCHCGSTFRDQYNLNRHLDKKNPCTPLGTIEEAPEWVCITCKHSYSTKGNYEAHLKSKIHERLTAESSLDEVLSQAANERPNRPSRRDLVTLTPPQSVTGVQDLRQEQFYLGFAGPPEVWSDIKRTDGTPFVPRPDQLILKLGKHDLNTARSVTHTREYGVWQVLDSVLTNNPTRVERDIKDDLKNRNELLSALHKNKTTRDTELIAVNASEYKAIVGKAIQMAAKCGTKIDMEMERELTRRQEVKADAEARKAEAESQARIAESNVRLLELQIRMKQLETSS